MTLSDFEFEVMQVFWEIEEASSPQVHKIVCIKKDAKYTTVKTIIDRLEKKGALRRSKNEGRTIFYTPLIEKQSIRKPLIKEFIGKLFSGKSRSLAAHIVEEEELSKEDIEYLEALLKERKEKLNR